MNTVTDNDLRELKDLIKDLRTELKSEILDFKNESIRNQLILEGKINNLETKVTGLSVQISELKEYSSKRLDDNNTRLNITTTGFLTIIGIFVTALLGIIAKVVFFPNI